MEEFSITDHQRNTIRVVRVKGEVDVFSAPRLREHAMTEPMTSTTSGPASGRSGRPRQNGHYAPGFVLDLGDVTFMDSAGLGVCVAVLKRAGARGDQVAVVAAAPVVLRLLDITGVPALYPVHTSVDEAVRSMEA